MDWYQETLHSDIRQALAVARVLHREQTDYQDLVIFENPGFGRVMALDGVIQTTEGDEFIYHEMLAHMPIFAQKAVQGWTGEGAGEAAGEVLIVGGGDGGALREVLRHREVRATMVEIDGSVIEMSREHLPNHSAGAFDDPRAEIVIADGARFVEETDRRFDVVIIDSTDPIGPGAVLFTERFYAGCRRCLKPGGVLITQNGVPFLQGSEVSNNHRYFGRLFADHAFYVAPVPTYNGGFMAFGWATDNADLRRVRVERIAALQAESGIETRYFNADIFQGAFALPNYVRQLMA